MYPIIPSVWLDTPISKADGLGTDMREPRSGAPRERPAEESPIHHC